MTDPDDTPGRDWLQAELADAFHEDIELGPVDIRGFHFV
jgi:hypothetical protein